MKALKIPIACDADKQFVRPTKAEKGRPYFCPACLCKVVFRSGTQKQPHFAHRASTSCSVETVIHKAAKSLIVQEVTKWKAGPTPAPIVRRKCGLCGCPMPHSLPDKVEGAVVEHRLPDGFIADVALLSGGVAIAVVEVRVHHAIEEEKATRLSVPFIEVEGKAIIESSASWTPIVDGFKPLVCQPCRKALKERGAPEPGTDDLAWFSAKVATIAERTGITLPAHPYVYAPFNCWKCHEEILVFLWPRRDQLWSRAQPPDPIPKTVRLRRTTVVKERYWANICPCCGSTQGDNYILLEPESPFWLDEEWPEPEHWDREAILHAIAGRVADLAREKARAISLQEQQRQEIGTPKHLTIPGAASVRRSNLRPRLM